MLMITPAGERFRCGIAQRVTLNVPLRLTATTFSHASGSIVSTGTVGPAMPALLTSTSSPPSAATPDATMSSTSRRLATSQRLAIASGNSFANDASASGVDVADEHPCAGRGECVRDLTADAGRAGRDQNALRHGVAPLVGRRSFSGWTGGVNARNRPVH